MNEYSEGNKNEVLRKLQDQCVSNKIIQKKEIPLINSSFRIQVKTDPIYLYFPAINDERTPHTNPIKDKVILLLSSAAKC